MKVRLLYADRDPDLDAKPLEENQDLARDLGLETLIEAMAAGDPYLREVAAGVLLTSMERVEDINYRQQVLIDCQQHPGEVQALYDLAVHAIESKRRIRWGLFGDHPGSVLHHSVALLTELTDHLTHLRRFSTTHADLFESEALRALFTMVDHDLDDAYMATLMDHLARLGFPNGVFMTATLDSGCRGTNYVLRKPISVKRSWRDLLSFGRQAGVYSHRIPERDENGARTLSHLKDRGLNQAANAAAQSAEHVLDFFNRLRWELGFYIGALHLHERLQQSQLPVCLPIAQPVGRLALEGRDVCDAGLGLRTSARLVGSDLDANGKTLVMITGANQGGKSTFLRALGLAQLMMQAGLFVTANAFSASISTGLFTHYRREEDSAMRSGKLDEELKRMSEIADSVTPGGMVLFNESFACTNEREGSDIARNIISALQDSGVRIFYVTHMFDLSNGLALRARASDAFLRAERHDDGSRTFRIRPGAPEPTSYGRDLYSEVFAT